MKIESINHAEKILKKYVPNVSKFIGDGMSLDRMNELLDVIGNPQNNLKVIHIAGTSGKTSTCHYVASILQGSGKKIGLTVSPHIDLITERLQINGSELPERIFCQDLSEFLEIIKGKQVDPSYFELLIAFVFWSANKHNIEYLVLETGMGGLLDATNVVDRRDKVCGITDIGFDHMHVLGTTLPEISRQKAGIIQEENAVFMFEQSDEVMIEVLRRVKDKNASLYTFSEPDLRSNSSLKLEKLAEFQKRNWLLAEQICNYVAKRDNLTLVLPDTSSVIVPGRIEIKKLKDDSTLIYDGAHNQQKMEVFVRSFKALFPGRKADILIALKEGKEYKDVLEEISSICNRMIITNFNTTQDLPAVSQDPLEVKECATTLGIDSIIIDDCNLAFEELLSRSSGIKLVTGSFYLIGQIRKNLNH